MEKSREDDFEDFSVDEGPAIACVGEERPTSRLLDEDSLLFSLNETSDSHNTDFLEDRADCPPRSQYSASSRSALLDATVDGVSARFSPGTFFFFFESFLSSIRWMGGEATEEE